MPDIKTMAEFMRQEFGPEPPAPECVVDGCTEFAGGDFEVVGKGYTCNPCGIKAWEELDAEQKGTA